MGLIVNTTDFVGKYALAQNSFSNLGDYITQFERNYLYKLLGKELADLFIADLSNYVPQTTRFENIYNQIIGETNGICYFNEGMKNMMLGFIYFEYQRMEKIQSTVSGSFANTSETAREVGFMELNLYGRYNQSVKDFKEIQRYCLNESATYPEFDGYELDYSHWSI